MVVGSMMNHIVKVLLANCTEEIWDRDAVTYGGKLNRQKGKVIVKWQGRRPKGVAEHQEWPMFAVTEVGFALVLDPWGNPIAYHLGMR